MVRAHEEARQSGTRYDLGPDAEQGDKGLTSDGINVAMGKFDEYFAKNKLMHKKAIAFLASEKGKGWQDPDSKTTQAMIISRLKHEKAKHLLFRILEEKIEQWWN